MQPWGGGVSVRRVHMECRKNTPHMHRSWGSDAVVSVDLYVTGTNVGKIGELT